MDHPNGFLLNLNKNIDHPQWNNLMISATVPAATSATSPEYVPWKVVDDKMLVCLVKAEPASKHLMSLAETMCTVTKERGITEIKLVDHTVRPKVKA